MDWELRKLWVVASAKTSEEPSFLSSLFFPNSMSECLQIPGFVLFDFLSKTWTRAMPVEPKDLLSRSHRGALLLDRIRIREYPGLYHGVQLLALHRTAPKITPEFVQTEQMFCLMTDAGFECWGGGWLFDLHVCNAAFLSVVTKKQATKGPSQFTEWADSPQNHPVLVVPKDLHRDSINPNPSQIRDAVGFGFFFFPKNPLEKL